MVMVYKPNSFSLDCGRGAITQLSGMEHHQTRINAVESGGKISAQLEPSTLKASSLDMAINDGCSLKRDISLYKRVRFYSNGI
jgi:hypothetical protein